MEVTAILVSEFQHADRDPSFFYKHRKFSSQPILTNEYFSESSRRVDYFYEIIFIKMSHFQKILVMSHRI